MPTITVSAYNLSTGQQGTLHPRQELMSPHPAPQSDVQVRTYE